MEDFLMTTAGVAVLLAVALAGVMCALLPAALFSMSLHFSKGKSPSPTAGRILLVRLCGVLMFAVSGYLLIRNLA
ncbi:hypothetical protein [Streptomyces zingiberis]|uniref:Uncharacterized protein n=1 Tax=Streptomyces zingiberis TaxID=2053010 RepID=A0ABX1BU77_9ACTN|nr:hypothetical protein [Streptomyces zingiberis]NJQ01236.1 hypothetical protein [Streptomyces zingiberis]